MADLIFEELKNAVAADDVDGVATILDRHPEMIDALSSVRDGRFGCVLGAIRGTAMSDQFLSRGVTVEMISDWWATGFGLDQIPTLLAEHLVERGATVSPHAAAALGLVGALNHLLDQQPELIHAKGGDGCRPLHLSRNVEVARLLLDRGAELDAKDDDHNSTAAQWRIAAAPEVTRFLIERGAKPDIFMAAALPDMRLAAMLVSSDPACVTHRIGHNDGPYPGIGFRGRGGTIYQWTLGFNQSPQEIAHHRGHREMFDYLMERTPPRASLLVACMLGNRQSAETLLAQHPGLVEELGDEDKALLAKSCWETNLNADAVKLMLDLGFPIDLPETSHGFQALHNAAWCGAADLVELLIRRGHPTDRRDPQHHATALGFAIHSCTVAKRHPEGDFPRVVRLLLEAGVPLGKHEYPSGHKAIDEVISNHLKSRDGSL